MGRTHDITISAFDLDRLEAELTAVTKERDRLERERDEYKQLLIELHNDINVIHSGNAIAKMNKMFKEENYN